MLLLIGGSFVIMAILIIIIVCRICVIEQDIQQINTDIHDIVHGLPREGLFCSKDKEADGQKGDL